MRSDFQDSARCAYDGLENRSLGVAQPQRQFIGLAGFEKVLDRLIERYYIIVHILATGPAVVELDRVGGRQGPAE